MSNKLKAAAERWNAGHYDDLSASCKDSSELADAMVARLAADEQQAKEDAEPIAEEWLRSLGFVAEHDLAWHMDRVSVRQYSQCVSDDTESVILLDDNEIMWRATRGQLRKLLEALKGGA